MHTLFSSNILSPSPVPKTQRDPFELNFHASLSTDSTASASSSPAQSSPTEYSLLTRRLQDERQAAQEFRNIEPVTVRRKGHPKLLLMGQRRCDDLNVGWKQREANISTGVASPRSRMSYYRKCLRRRLSILSRPTR
jgi:hypothetical protein